MWTKRVVFGVACGMVLVCGLSGHGQTASVFEQAEDIYAAGDLAGASTLYRQVVSASEEYGESELAKSKLRLAEYEKAQDDRKAELAYLKDITASHPGVRETCALAEVRIGKLLLEHALLSEAKEQLQKAIEDYPDQAETVCLARLALADCYASANKRDKAIQECGLVLKAYEEGAATDVEAAWAQFKIGAYTAGDETLYGTRKAIPELEKVLKNFGALEERGPCRAARQKLAECYLDDNRKQDAMVLLDDLVADEEVGADEKNWARAVLVRAYADTGDHKRAIATAKDMVASYRAGESEKVQAAWAHYLMGESYLAQGDKERAIETLREHVVQFGDHPDSSIKAEERLAKLLQKEGRGEEAYGHLVHLISAYIQDKPEQVCHVAGDAADLYRKTGEISKEIGVWRAAIGDLADLDMFERHAARKIANIYRREGKSELATALFEYFRDPEANPDPTAEGFAP